jgi:hypothetical protein
MHDLFGINKTEGGGQYIFYKMSNYFATVY